MVDGLGLGEYSRSRNAILRVSGSGLSSGQSPRLGLEAECRARELSHEVCRSDKQALVGPGSGRPRKRP